MAVAGGGGDPIFFEGRVNRECRMAQELWDCNVRTERKIAVEPLILIVYRGDLHYLCAQIT